MVQDLVEDLILAACVDIWFDRPNVPTYLETRVGKLKPNEYTCLALLVIEWEARKTEAYYDNEMLGVC